MTRLHAWMRALGALLLVISACTSSGSRDLATKTCAETSGGQTSDGEVVDICEKLYTERPYVRPPADTVVPGGLSTLYLAAVDSLYSRFVDRGGTMYRTVDAGGIPLDVSALPSSLRAPSKRNLYLIYRVHGTVGTFKDDQDPRISASIRITDAQPAILIKGKAIDGAFLGAWEGTVSKRADDSTCTITPQCWDQTQQVPLRVSFRTLVPIENIGALAPTGPKLPDGERFKLVGAIDNVRDAVRLSDGRCIEPLAALGKADPFRPSTAGDLALRRFPAMHAVPDDALVVDYPKDADSLGGADGMAVLNVLHAANLLLKTETAEWNSMSIHNHGTPNGNEINLHPVTGGGGSCTP